MQIQPYLFFNGRCEEAVEFYRKALGAKVEMLMRYKDSPEPPPPGMVPPGSENKVMHASLTVGDTIVMASDGNCAGQAAFKASRCPLRRRAPPRPSGCSRPWPTAGRSRCHSPRPSGRPASAWLPIASAWGG